MKTRRIFFPAPLALGALLAFPALLPSQRPQQPGKLSVSSTPPGAIITIDKQNMNQATNFTFVLSPGNHTVSVKGENLGKCATAAKVVVRSYAVTSISCTAAGWSSPTIK